MEKLDDECLRSRDTPFEKAIEYLNAISSQVMNLTNRSKAVN